MKRAMWLLVISVLVLLGFILSSNDGPAGNVSRSTSNRANERCATDVTKTAPTAGDGIGLTWSAPSSIVAVIHTASDAVMRPTMSEYAPDMAAEAGHVGYVKTYQDIPSGTYKLIILDEDSDYLYEERFAHSDTQMTVVTFVC